jgi:transcription antitermination protein NusB
MSIKPSEDFPLSKINKLKGNRRFLREKALQIVISIMISESPFETLFNHIFFREFNFGEETEENKPTKLLRPDEVLELEADIPIEWRKSDIDFCVRLVNKALDVREMVDNLITDIVKNWELDRLAIVDKVLVYLATAEFIYFQDIPTKVTINEAIEIAKDFSTDRSSYFINGLLDAVHERLKSEGKIVKEGRGLISDS